MRYFRSVWVLALAATLAFSSVSCKKGSSKSDTGLPGGEPAESNLEEDSPAAAGTPAKAVTSAASDPAAGRQPPIPPDRTTAAAPANQITGSPAATPVSSPPAAAAQAPAPVQPAVPQSPRVALPDPRLLLTLKDVQDLSKGKVTFRRVAIQGVPVDEDTDGILYEPEKGAAFGAALQVFRGRNVDAMRDRFAGMMASYPSAQEIPPVAGKTFFAYWEELLYIGFQVPGRNLVVVLSCGRKYCDSDGLYELARKIGARTNG